ncbi:MAG: phosphatase PAP2 family protein [Lachnospiraceae bacterium]|nr:phosphatase PAP2 family protein [Lachnospiraceae bacterium]
MSELEILHAIQNLHTVFLDHLMTLVSALGDHGILWVAIALLLLFSKKTRRCGILMAVSMLICLILGNGILKNTIYRARPCWVDDTVQMLVNIPTDYSFPSGHTMHGFAAATVIWLHDRRAGAAALVLAAVIAFSRLYLFVHYPTDVLAGFCIGTLTAILVVRIDRILRMRKNGKCKERGSMER